MRESSRSQRFHAMSVVTMAGMNCADCAAPIVQAVSGRPGVERTEVDLTAGELRVVHDPARALVALVPARARIICDGTEATISTHDLRTGRVVRITRCEKMRLDADEMARGSAMNQSPIARESIPVEKRAGDTVYGGSVHGRGRVDVRVPTAAEDPTIAYLIRLVEAARRSTGKAQCLIERVGEVETTSPPRGVLVKGGTFIEMTGSLRAVAFDRIGTLTGGRPTVADVIPSASAPTAAALRITALLEGRSEHPLADAIVAAAKEKSLALPDVTSFASFAGDVVQGTLAASEDTSDVRRPRCLGEGAMPGGAHVATVEDDARLPRDCAHVGQRRSRRGCHQALASRGHCAATLSLECPGSRGRGGSAAAFHRMAAAHLVVIGRARHQ